MDAASAIAGTAGTQYADPSTAAKKNLDAEDFLKLLTVQLSNQDPLEPMKDTDFIAQMANFSSLEQMRELGKSFDNFAEEQQRVAAQAYLGKEVTLAPAGAKETTGTVSAISRDDEGNLTVTVGDGEYSVSDIRRVSLPQTEG
jgi:flagellar basal-body rod modification protein FlgD